MRLPEPYVFFVDRSLGAHVIVGALRRVGLEVRPHDEHFDPRTTDATWLAEVGRRGWVVLTKDVTIRHDSLERRALLAANLAVFMLARSDVTASRMAEAIAIALPAMFKALRRFHVPFIARITIEGEVAVVHDGAGLLQPPKRLKAKLRPSRG